MSRLVWVSGLVNGREWVGWVDWMGECLGR